MCMEDIRLGRKMTCAEGKTALVANTPVIVVPASKLRVGLIISGNSTAPVTLGFDNTIVVGNGIIIPINQRPIFMSIKDWGEIIRRPIWGVANVALNCCFWESLLEANPEDSQGY